MIKVAIVGYGNIGKYAMEAVLASPDMELSGIIVRWDINKKRPSELANIKMVNDIVELGKIDVAILCTPTRSVLEIAEKCLEMGISTVDSYDIHSDIVELRRKLDAAAKSGNASAILSAGWDPGSDSLIRALLLACAPNGITYTNFGPGMSMGHTVAVKAINGVKSAISMTIPLGAGIHRRMVYVELCENADIDKVTADIKADAYFKKDETHVIQVEDINTVIDRGSGVNIYRKGVSGATDNQLFEFNMKINNPALTSQIMVSCARAVLKQKPGAYTLIEIPVIDMLFGDREAIIKSIV